MIIKNIFNIHPLYYFVGALCFLTGNFKDFIIFSAIIIVHEFGHIIGAFICKWHIEKVILLPFGGITIFKEKIDKPLKQEFLITILGPLFQLIFYLLYKDNYIFSFYNKALFLFNLLPIYPLDGSKLINTLLNRFISFKRSHIVTITISTIILILTIFFSITVRNLLFVLILFFLTINNIKEIHKHKYYFNKFLLERYLYPQYFKRKKTVKKIEQMKKQTKHIFFVEKKYFTEKEIITKMFDN